MNDSGLVCTHLFLHCISQGLVNELREEIVQPAETQNQPHKWEEIKYVQHDKSLHHLTWSLLLPGSTVEFDSGAAYSGRAAHVADLRSACLVTPDCNT